MLRKIAPNGENAVTHFEVLKKLKNGNTLMKFVLKTGRTHQIRVHMAQIGYPVVGDATYSSGKNPFGVTSQMLHSHILGFVHPTKNLYSTDNGAMIGVAGLLMSEK